MGTRLVLALLIALTAGCRARPSASQNPVPVEQRLGWVTGSCLATTNASLPADTGITVVSLDEKASLLDGRVVGPTTSAEVCAPLMPDRRRSNSQWAFYELRLSGTADLGIGVTGNVTRANGGIDLDGDGVPEKFTQCATSEGVSFRAWNGTPYQGKPLWTGYYYLGYDTDANCPS